MTSDSIRKEDSAILGRNGVYKDYHDPKVSQ